MNTITLWLAQVETAQGAGTAPIGGPLGPPTVGARSPGCAGPDFVIPLVLLVTVAIVWAIVWAVRSSSTPAPASSGPGRIASRLKNLEGLHRDGLITDDELARRRAEILRDT